MAINIEDLMKEWEKAGVTGGIPADLTIVQTIKPGDSIQKAIDDAAAAGGGVVLLKKGTYDVSDQINFKSNVVLRGEDRDDVILQTGITTDTAGHVLFFNRTEYSGVENLTINYEIPNIEPVRDAYKPGQGTNDRKDLDVASVAFWHANNSWVKDVNIFNSGSDPIRVDGTHNTFTGNYIKGAHIKSGGEGYYRVRGDYNLLDNETILEVRHLGIQSGAEFNVVTNSFLSTDINFHTGDDGSNLIEGNTVNLHPGHFWVPLGTGDIQFGHKPPGPDNIFYNNKFLRDGKPVTDLDEDVVYTFDGFNVTRGKSSYGVPVEAGVEPPTGGRFYTPPTHPPSQGSDPEPQGPHSGEEGEAVARINAGGEKIAATDGGIDWAADDGATTGTSTAGFNVTPGSGVSTATPAGLFATERWDNGDAGDLAYDFSVVNGDYEVRLYIGEGYSGASAPGARVFDVQLEGETPAAFDDIDASSLFGFEQGGVISATTTVTDGELNIDFLRGVQNPMVNGIEIIARDLTSLSGEVFSDENGNDVKDDDSHVGGVAVTLLSNGKVIAQTTTASDGGYRFEGLIAGEYTVRFDAGEREFVNADVGGFDVDSDVVFIDGSIGETDVFITEPGQDRLAVDAGLKLRAPDPEPGLQNTAPEAQADAVSLGQGQSAAVDVLANDTDSDGDALSISAVTTSEGVQAEIVDGAVRVTADEGFSGAATVGYEISDGVGGAASAEIAVTVVAPPPEPITLCRPCADRSAGVPPRSRRCAGQPVEGQ